MGDKNIMKQDVQKEIEEFNKNIDKYYEEKRVLFLEDQLFYISSIRDNSITLVFLKHNIFCSATKKTEDFVMKNRLFLNNREALDAYNTYYQKTLATAKDMGMSLIYDKTTSIIMDRMTFYHNAYESLHTTPVNFYGEFLDK